MTLKAVAGGGGGAASGITIGTSVITGGTTLRLLYDLAGVISETANWTYVAASGLLQGTATSAIAIGGATIGTNDIAGPQWTIRTSDGKFTTSGSVNPGNSFASIGGSGLGIYGTVTIGLYGWTASATAGNAALDTGFSRVSAGLAALGTGAQGSFAGSLKLTDIFTNNAAALIRTNTALTDGAAAALGTLTNAPTAGNPTKWISIDDNGTTRRIPAW